MFFSVNHLNWLKETYQNDHFLNDLYCLWFVATDIVLQVNFYYFYDITV